MSAYDRINSLKTKHAELEAELEAELKSIGSDTTIINDIKRRKLAIRDEIERLSRDATG